MGKLWTLYEEYRDRLPYPPSQRQVAAKLGMSPTALGNWQGRLTRLPSARNLAQFADLTHLPYTAVLDAALHDAGYLPKPEPMTRTSWEDRADLPPEESARVLSAVIIEHGGHVDDDDGEDLAAHDEEGSIEAEQDQPSEP